MNRKLVYLPNYTYDDYVHWEGKWELISGIPVAMSPSPGIRHQEISGAIHAELLAKLGKCQHSKALLALDWKVADNTVLQPDNLVYCKPFENENYLTAAPSLIFEILSPSTTLKDKNTKFYIYESAGVKYYVMVNPKTSTAEIFEWSEEGYKRAGEISTETYLFRLDDCELSFDFAKIWG